MVVPVAIQGEVNCTITLVTAESGRRYTESDVRVAEQLADRAAAALENARLYATAQHAIFVREQILAMVAHDLRNQLMIIGTGASVLSQTPGPVGTDRIQKIAKRIVPTIGTMRRLLDDLLDMGAIEAGKLSFTCEAVVRCKLDLAMDQQTRLEAALLAARQASEAKSNFLAQMSHELRTPLNAIIGFSDIISRELFGGVGQNCYREYASDILAAGQHLLELINNLLDLSKAEAGKLELCDEAIDVAVLCEECIRLVLVRAREQQVRLVTTVPGNLPAFRADRLRIKQILVNLLSNATKFTPEGGSVELCAQLARDGGFEFLVSDTGIGMAPEMIPVALEPFRQLGSPTSARSVEGTGLGLSLAKSLTEQHGGTITIESEVDQGTRVTMHFPPGRTEYTTSGTGAPVRVFASIAASA